MVNKEEQKPIISLREAADLLGVSTRTLLRWGVPMVSPAGKCGRKFVFRRALQEWLEARGK